MPAPIRWPFSRMQQIRGSTRFTLISREYTSGPLFSWRVVDNSTLRFNFPKDTRGNMGDGYRSSLNYLPRRSKDRGLSCFSYDLAQIEWRNLREKSVLGDENENSKAHEVRARSEK